MYVTPFGRAVCFERLILPPPGHCELIVDIVAESNASTQFQIEELGLDDPENDRASLPAMSWIAAFEVDELAASATYETRTSVPLGTEFDPFNVSKTVFPLIEMAVGVTAVSPTKTVNAFNAGVGVDFKDSLKLSETEVPLAETLANVGGAISGPATELLVTA